MRRTTNVPIAAQPCVLVGRVEGRGAAEAQRVAPNLVRLDAQSFRRPLKDGLQLSPQDRLPTAPAEDELSGLGDTSGRQGARTRLDETQAGDVQISSPLSSRILHARLSSMVLLVDIEPF